MLQIRLKKNEGRRFLAGHPWVFSNEIEHSNEKKPAIVEICDPAGGFLAKGFYQPSSLISFREYSRDSSITIDRSFVFAKLSQARDLRSNSGFDVDRHSMRLCFAESDGLPGLVIDQYVHDDGSVLDHRQGKADVRRFEKTFVIQFQSSAAEFLRDWVIQHLRVIDERAAILVRNDVSIRKLENLPEEVTLVEKGHGMDLSSVCIRVGGLDSTGMLITSLFDVDLMTGQKTGFFLDQRRNVDLLAREWTQLGNHSGSIQVLDLFSYVGQWPVGLKSRLPNADMKFKCVDSSGPALEWCTKNAKKAGADCSFSKEDIFETCLNWPMPSSSFAGWDVIVCDPPALVKNRKAIPTGEKAYQKLNTECLKRIRKGGLLMTCSCSGLLTEERFLEIIAASAKRAGKKVRIVSRGGHSLDHSDVLHFREASYLKGILLQVLE